MTAISIMTVVTELIVVLAFVCLYSLSYVTAFYCELQECKFVVSIMIWMVTIPPREPMVWNSAAQTSDGKLMNADPQISIKYSFRDPEGSTSYTRADKPRITALLLL